jgi:hypothetical protein
LAGAVKPVFVRRLRFNVATLDAFLTNLKQSQEQWLEKVGSQSDKMTSVPPDYAMIPVLANYPSAEAEAVARKSGSGDRNPYCIDITDGARLADFKKTRTIMVEILAPKDGEQSSLFAGLSNVRILEVRVWLMGLVLPERGAQISINIYRDCASGDTILPRNGTEQIFFHDPISGPFQYSLPTPTEPYIGHAFSLVGGARKDSPDLDSVLASCGPFGIWRFTACDVIVPGGSKANKDKRIESALANLWRITIEFFAQAQ